MSRWQLPLMTLTSVGTRSITIIGAQAATKRSHRINAKSAMAAQILSSWSVIRFSMLDE